MHTKHTCNNIVEHVTFTFDPWPWKSIVFVLLSKLEIQKYDSFSSNSSLYIDTV